MQMILISHEIEFQAAMWETLANEQGQIHVGGQSFEFAKYCTVLPQPKILELQFRILRGLRTHILF